MRQKHRHHRQLKKSSPLKVSPIESLTGTNNVCEIYTNSSFQFNSVKKMATKNNINSVPDWLNLVKYSHLKLLVQMIS